MRFLHIDLLMILLLLLLLLLLLILLLFLVILAFLRLFIPSAFQAACFGDPLDLDDFLWSESPNATLVSPRRSSDFPLESEMRIQKTLHVVRFGQLLSGDGESTQLLEVDKCAVCLYEFELQDEVRRLGNCRHVFHRHCLDRWVEYGRRTCPLCRIALVH